MKVYILYGGYESGLEFFINVLAIYATKEAAEAAQLRYEEICELEQRDDYDDTWIQEVQVLS